MPLIIRFLNCAIYVNTRDHNPPHFHIRTNDGRDALVEIETMAIVSHRVSRREVKEALEWANNNRSLLSVKFKEYNP